MHRSDQVVADWFQSYRKRLIAEKDAKLAAAKDAQAGLDLARGGASAARSVPEEPQAPPPPRPPPLMPAVGPGGGRGEQTANPFERALQRVRTAPATLQAVVLPVGRHPFTRMTPAKREKCKKESIPPLRRRNLLAEMGAQAGARGGAVQRRELESRLHALRTTSSLGHFGLPSLLRPPPISLEGLPLLLGVASGGGAGEATARRGSGARGGMGFIDAAKTALWDLERRAVAHRVVASAGEGESLSELFNAHLEGAGEGGEVILSKQDESLAKRLAAAIKRGDDVLFMELYDQIPSDYSQDQVDQIKKRARQIAQRLESEEQQRKSLPGGAPPREALPPASVASLGLAVTAPGEGPPPDAPQRPTSSISLAAQGPDEPRAP
eukprot:tig00001339_g8268.t1